MFGSRHRRAQSDVGPPTGQQINTATLRSPDSLTSSHTHGGVLSPSVVSKRISEPVPANDPDIVQKLTEAKEFTIRQMLSQVTEEFELIRLECQASGTELNYSRLEQKGQVLQRLRSQLSSVTSPGIGDHFESRLTDQPIFEDQDEGDHDGRRRSLNLELDNAAALPPLPQPPLLGDRKKSRKMELMADGGARKEVMLSRSHSDSYRRGRKLPVDDGLRHTASSDALEKVQLAAVAGSASVSIASSTSSESLKNRTADQDVSRSRSKSQEMGSMSDDPTGDVRSLVESPLSPVNERSPRDSIFSENDMSRLSRPTAIMGMEDDDLSEEEADPDQGVFSDFCLLRDKPAHLAVLLHYLISNSNPQPLLFYLVTEQYVRQNSKDVKDMHKWAYEIYSSFLAEKSPLKVNLPEETVNAIESLLSSKAEKEDDLKKIFMSARNQVQAEIGELLADYRSKRALGLGSLYGDQHLADKMDTPSIMKSVERSLWNHFERLVADENNDRNLLIASCLATFFKYISYTNNKGSSNLEKCPTFVAKDKKTRFLTGKLKTKTITSKSHNFQQQQYVSATLCAACHSILYGIGYQGFQCTKCDQNVHKGCIESLDACASKKPVVPTKIPRNRPQSFFNKAHGRIPSLASTLTHAKEPVQPEDNTHAVPARQEEKCEDENDKEESGRRPSDELKLAPEVPVADVNYQSDPENGLRSPTIQTIGQSRFPDVSDVPIDFLSPDTQQLCADDPDLTTEADLPPLESFIPKDVLKKLKPKDKKWQDVVNELFYTERTHVRNLKVMQQLFYRPWIDDPSIATRDFVLLLFPNIDDMVQIHSALNNDFKQRRKESPHSVVINVGDILTRWFTGEEGEKFKSICAVFCQNQKHALERLRARQTQRNTSAKDQKFLQYLQTAISNPLCRKLALKDLLPTAMQRLTKYPLLIEKLLSYSSDQEEISHLQTALTASKLILNHVNHAVTECENRQKLADMQRRLDLRHIENSTDEIIMQYKNLDLTHFRLLYDGILTWRLSKAKEIEVHVVLIDDAIILLQRQDEKLLLRCQSKDDRNPHTHSPIIRLSTVLVRSVANDKRALYVVSTSHLGPQIYELVTNSRDERNKWLKYITEAADVYKESNPVKIPAKRPPTKVSSSKSLPSVESARQETVSEELPKHNVTELAAKFEALVEQTVTSELPTNSTEMHDHAPESNSSVCEEMVTSIASSTGDSIQSSLDKLRETNESVHQMMMEKQQLLASLLQVPSESFEAVAELSIELACDKDPRELVLASLKLADRLTSIVNDHIPSDNLTTSSLQESSLTVIQSMQPSLSQLIKVSSQLQQNLTQLLGVIIQKEDEQSQLQSSLRIIQDQLAMNGEPVDFERDPENSLGLESSLHDADLEQLLSAAESTVCHQTVECESSTTQQMVESSPGISHHIGTEGQDAVDSVIALEMRADATEHEDMSELLDDRDDKSRLESTLLTEPDVGVENSLASLDMSLLSSSFGSPECERQVGVVSETDLSQQTVLHLTNDDENVRESDASAVSHDVLDSAQTHDSLSDVNSTVPVVEIPAVEEPPVEKQLPSELPTEIELSELQQGVEEIHCEVLVSDEVEIRHEDDAVGDCVSAVDVSDVDVLVATDSPVEAAMGSDGSPADVPSSTDGMN